MSATPTNVRTRSQHCPPSTPVVTRDGPASTPTTSRGCPPSTPVTTRGRRKRSSGTSDHGAKKAKTEPGASNESEGRKLLKRIFGEVDCIDEVKNNNQALLTKILGPTVQNSNDINQNSADGGCLSTQNQVGEYMNWPLNPERDGQQYLLKGHENCDIWMHDHKRIEEMPVFDKIPAEEINDTPLENADMKEINVVNKKSYEDEVEGKKRDHSKMKVGFEIDAIATELVGEIHEAMEGASGNPGNDKQLEGASDTQKAIEINEKGYENPHLDNQQHLKETPSAANLLEIDEVNEKKPYPQGNCQDLYTEDNHLAYLDHAVKRCEVLEPDRNCTHDVSSESSSSDLNQTQRSGDDLSTDSTNSDSCEYVCSPVLNFQEISSLKKVASWSMEGQVHSLTKIVPEDVTLVTDVENNCIFSFGKKQEIWAQATRFHRPKSIRYSSVSKTVFVLDQYAIFRFDTKGNFIEQGFPNMTWRLRGLCVAELPQSFFDSTASNDFMEVLITTENSVENGIRVLFISPDLRKQKIYKEIKLVELLEVNDVSSTKFLYMDVCKETLALTDIGHGFLILLNLSKPDYKYNAMKVVVPRPSGVAFDGEGNVVVASVESNNLTVYNKYGSYIRRVAIPDDITPIDLNLLYSCQEIHLLDGRNRSLVKLAIDRN